MSELITSEQMTQMVENFRANATQHQAGETTFDFKPVVKLFKPKDRATWLLTEYDPDFGILFGLCDMGLGFPEIGNVTLGEFQSVVSATGIKVDTAFQATKTLSEYAADAQRMYYGLGASFLPGARSNEVLFMPKRLSNSDW